MVEGLEFHVSPTLRFMGFIEGLKYWRDVGTLGLWSRMGLGQ